MSLVHIYRWWIASLLLLFSSELPAQISNARFDHILVEHGLSNFSPFHIVQDKFGFLWIGTEDGLNRYDGHTFNVYKHIPGDSTSMPTNTITGLAVDRNGNLWITASTEEIVLYNPDADSFVRYNLSDGNVPPPGFRLVANQIAPDEKDDLLWVATNRGLRLFDPNNGSVQTMLVKQDDSTHFESNVVTAVAVDRDGNVWVGSSNGIHRFNKQTGQFTSYFPNRRYPHETQSRDVVTSIAIDGRRTVWAGTFGGLMRYDTGPDKFVPVRQKIEGRDYTLGDSFIVPMHVDASGDLWLGTFSEGMFKYDAPSNTFIHFRSDPQNPRSLLTNRVTCIYQDRSGVLWAGCYRSGLNRYSRREDQFTHYNLSSSVYAVWEDSFGDLWIGTNGDGLFRYNKGKGKPQRFRARKNDTKSLDDDRIYSLFEEKNGDMWIGTAIGVERYHRATGTFTKYVVTRPDRKNMEQTIKSLLIDRDGDLWAGSIMQGLYRLNRRTNRFVAYRHDPDDSLSLSNEGIWSLFQDSKGRIWVATFGGGLHLFDKARNAFIRRYNSRGDDSTTISGDAIYTVREDKNGNLWLGTFSTGVTLFNPETGKCKRYYDRDGLADNFVKTILFDSRGNPWMGTDKGISHLDIEAGQFENYKEKDGLHNAVLLSGAAFRSLSGRFYFGGENGVTAFHPDSLKRSTYKPPIVITRFQVFDKPFPLSYSIMKSPQIELSYDQNSFSFEFVSLDYTLPEKNIYAYRLDGIDQEWIHAGTRRYASYSHLPAGEYMFRVVATNSDGIWDFDGASVRIMISPPFWGTWWFRIAVGLAVIGIGAWVYNYRVNRLLEIERLRVRIASDLHDDIGSSLTKISLQSELIQEGFDPEEQQNYLKNIATMSRELVTSMSDIVWSIDARNDTFENLFDKMRSFGLSTLSTKDIAFNLTYSGFDLKRKLPVDVRENVYLIFKEAINNIAKHSGANSVNVVLRNDSDKFSLVIVDDGKGWEGAERLSGHGTKNMKMRAERMGGRVDFVRDEGTRVVLTMDRV